MNPPQPPRKLLDQLSDHLRTRHYSTRTEQSYVEWARRYILFHQKRHPKDMGAPEVRAFLTHLALERKVAASTQNQALSALLFLYREVLNQPLSGIDAVRARQPGHLPTVLTKSEAAHVLSAMTGPTQLTPALALRASAVQVWPNSSTAAACAPWSAFACASKIWILSSTRFSSATAKAKKTASPCCPTV
ncbi:hypothetical protein ANRL2_01199 [Anaerolineae bacterium]|nr:hypothetical protein ANRL2_01199 [Anaerolineae bacterium]